MRAVDNLLAWEAFHSLARTGSVTQTAIAMDVEVSRVSRWVAGLEAELGCALLDKSRRPMTPTAAGAEFLRKTLAPVSALREAAGRKAAVDRQLFRFAAPTELGQAYFTDLLLRYTQAHPEVSFSIGPPIAAVGMHAGDADVAVVSTPESVDELVVRPYNVATGALLASPLYLELYGRPRTPADLYEYVGLLHVSPNNEATTALYHGAEVFEPLGWRRTFVSHDQLMLKRMLVEHLGITADLFPGHALEELRSGALVPVLPGWHRRPWQMSIVTRNAIRHCAILRVGWPTKPPCI